MDACDQTDALPPGQEAADGHEQSARHGLGNCKLPERLRCCSRADARGSDVSPSRLVQMTFPGQGAPLGLAQLGDDLVKAARLSGI
jgi:hypothetical protein